MSTLGNIIKIDKLGLAAYIKMKGSEENKTKLINYINGIFVFESEKTLLEWKIDYSNSCCFRHDSELCELRKHYGNQSNRV